MAEYVQNQRLGQKIKNKNQAIKHCNQRLRNTFTTAYEKGDDDKK
jgi:hypothetical protein